MNRTVASVTASLLLSSLVSALAWGQASSSNARDTQVEPTRIEQSQQRAADAWGLSEQEYQRYQTLMEGPRGLWSPQLDPLTALGIAARSDAERQKYAEMLVRTERRRVEAELAFQRAYDAAWQQLYPESRPVTPFTTQGDDDTPPSLFGHASSASPSRVNVVVATQGCGQCDATVKRLLGNGAAMDIWIVDAGGDDAQIRDWAVALGIPPNQVRDGHITLNHGGSLNVDRANLPRVAPRG